jgi:hypothetical protein
VCGYFKAETLGIVRPVVRLLVGKKTFRECYDLLTEKVEALLLKLSQTDRRQFAEERAAYLASKGVDLSGLDEPPAVAPAPAQ